MLSDPNSEMFKDMAGKIEVGLDELFVNSDLRKEAVFNIRVTDFRYDKKSIERYSNSEFRFLRNLGCCD